MAASAGVSGGQHREVGVAEQVRVDVADLVAHHDGGTPCARGVDGVPVEGTDVDDDDHLRVGGADGRREPLARDDESQLGLSTSGNGLCRAVEGEGIPTRTQQVTRLFANEVTHGAELIYSWCGVRWVPPVGLGGMGSMSIVQSDRQ
jgi:hypothetical protein